MIEYNYIISYSVESAIFQFPSTPRCEEFIKSYTLDEASSGKIEAIDNSFTFVGADFDKLVDAPFGTKFTMKIQRLPYQDNYYTGIFYIKDCEVNYDKKIIIVKLKTEDYLTEFQNVLDKEINLSDIAIKKTNIQHSVPPLLQIYVLGDDKLTNYQLGAYWEQDCEIVDFTNFSTSGLGAEDIDGQTYYKHVKISAYTRNAGSTELNQMWIAENANINNAAVISKFVSQDGLYYMEYKQLVSPIREWWEIKTVAGDTMIWDSDRIDNSIYTDISLFTFTRTGGTTTTTFGVSKRVVSRFITPYYAYAGSSILNDDTFCKNQNHTIQIVTTTQNPISRYNIEYAISTDTQINETQYKKAANGRYFAKKVSQNDYDYIGVGIGLWADFSIWVRGNNDLNTNIIDDVLVNYETQGFKIDDVFNAIFTHFNLPLRYASIYFNSATNPITSGVRLYPIITQVTNLNTNKETVQESTLATKNNITLIELIQYLKDRFNLSYHLQNGYFNLEHIYYYENNQSYDVNNTSYVDLTTKINQRVSKAWSFGMNQVKYNVKSFKRKIFKQDTASENLGNGVIDTDYCEDIVSVDYGRFYDDIGYLLSGTNEIRDGFFFGLYGSNYRLFYQQITVKGYIIHIQNHANSLPYVLKYLHNYNMQGDTFLLDGESINVLGFFRGKIQEIEVNMGVENDNADIYKLVKTDLGIAYIIKKVVNCDKKTVKYTVSHDID